jgi:hypothetical protein
LEVWTISGGYTTLRRVGPGILLRLMRADVMQAN